ncbi:MFS transporter [Streptomyces sp. NPDC101393]|uniref:MFS transporter n=1 Tax=Streptomyces sp. NPDC101393 TaxID=3366141 RepID=UPI00382C3C12
MAVLVAELMDILDQSVVLTALPSIQASTGAGQAAMQWLTAGWSLTVAVGLITGARLGDIYGRRQVLLIGTALFTLASLAARHRHRPRCTDRRPRASRRRSRRHGSVDLATLHVTFGGERRGSAFGLYGAALSMGSDLGPVLGGVLTQMDLFRLSWRPVFPADVPVGLAVPVLGRRFVPESTATKADQLDLTGMLLSAPTVVLIASPAPRGTPTRSTARRSPASSGKWGHLRRDVGPDVLPARAHEPAGRPNHPRSSRGTELTQHQGHGSLLRVPDG